MDVSLILKVAGVGMIVFVAYLLFSNVKRDEYATFVIVAGIIITSLMIISEIGKLFNSVRNVFGL